MSHTLEGLLGFTFVVLVVIFVISQFVSCVKWVIS